MKVQSEQTGTCEVTLTIEVDPERAQKAMQKTARDIAKQAPVPGFRPGKAPYRIVESYFGKDVILNRALETLGPELYQEAIKEANIEPYAQGNLDIAEKEPLTLKAVVPVMPVVELGDYRSIRQEMPELAFDEAEIEKAVAELQQRNAEWSPVERPAQEADQVTLDLKGTVDGEEVISQTNRKTLVVPEMYPQGLFENVVGLGPGGSADYEVAFDEENNNPKLAGKAVQFHLSVSGVNQKKLPELDDDFAKRIGGEYENMDALREGIRKSLHTSKEEDAREQVASDILLAILADAQIEYPNVALEHEIDLELYEMRQRLQSQGFSWESYLRMQNKTEQEIRDEMRPAAEQTLRESLALQEIAKREKIEVPDAEVEAEIDKIVQPYGAQAESFRPFYATEASKLSIRRRLILNKTMDWLIAMASGQLPEAQTPEEEATPEEAEAGEAEAPKEEAPEAAVAEAPEEGKATEASEAAE